MQNMKLMEKFFLTHLGKEQACKTPFPLATLTCVKLLLLGFPLPPFSSFSPILFLFIYSPSSSLCHALPHVLPFSTPRPFFFFDFPLHPSHNFYLGFPSARLFSLIISSLAHPLVSSLLSLCPLFFFCTSATLKEIDYRWRGRQG